MVKKNFEDMHNCLNSIPQTDRRTSCHGIVRAMHTRRAVKIQVSKDFDFASCSHLLWRQYGCLLGRLVGEVFLSFCCFFFVLKAPSDIFGWSQKPDIFQSNFFIVDCLLFILQQRVSYCKMSPS